MKRTFLSLALLAALGAVAPACSDDDVDGLIDEAPAGEHGHGDGGAEHSDAG